MTTMTEPRSQTGMHRYDEEFVAQVIHDAVRRFWILAGGERLPPWPGLSQAQREAAIEAVREARRGAVPTRDGTLAERDVKQMVYQMIVALTDVTR